MQPIRRDKGLLWHTSDAFGIGCLGVVVIIYGLNQVLSGDQLSVRAGKPSISGYVWLLLGTIWIGYCIRRVVSHLRARKRMDQSDVRP